MRNNIIFLNRATTASTLRFLDASRSLKLNPILLNATPWECRDIPAGNTIQLDEMTLDSVVAAIDRLGRETVAGVLTLESAQAELAARVAQAIGRPHSDPDAVALCNDKLEFRRFLERKGFSDVVYQNAATAEEAYTFAKNMGGHAVVKPHESSGSIGVRVCRSPEEARTHANMLLRGNPDGVLIEEYIQGPLYAADAFNGKVYGVRGLLVSDPPTPIVIGEETPANVPAEIHRSLSAYAEEVLALTGYTRGVGSVQMVYANNRPYMIEINPRVAGWVPNVRDDARFDVKVEQLCLKFASGIPVEVEVPDFENPKRYVATWYLVRINQSIRAIHGMKDALSVPYVVDVAVFPAGFDHRDLLPGAADRVAIVQSVASAPELAAESASAALRKLIQVPEGRLRFWLRRRFEKLFVRIRYGKALPDS